MSIPLPKSALYPDRDYNCELSASRHKEIIVHGHWHGAGGSYENEWYVYKVNKKPYALRYSIDIMPNGVNGEQRVSVYNGKWKLLSTKKSYYNKIYKTHIKKATAINKFKRYKLTDKKGLK